MQQNQPQRTTAALLAALALSALPLTGCVSTWFATTDKPAPAVQPNDFIGDPQPTNATDKPVESLVATDVETPEAGSDEPTASTRNDEALSVDAMVGHINGEAVYADEIFDVNLVAQLESFGRRYDGEEFRKYASVAIMDRLQGIVINTLILGEAERNLKEAQRRQIEGRINAEREELLRFYGQGSIAKAKAEFRKDRGKELDRHLVDFREELVIGSYIRSKVMPKIVVNQRDVERYYEDKKEKFNQPDQRAIRIIRATDEAAVQQIEARLKKGEAFDKIAANPELNSYNPDNAGIFNGGEPIPGEKVIGIAPVNEALLPLEAGQHAGPILAGENRFFVQVVSFEPGVSVSLAEAQIVIEKTLRSAQFEKHALRFRMDLLKRGSYSDPKEMGNKLVEIAYGRYDQ